MNVWVRITAFLIDTVRGTRIYHRTSNGKFVFNKAVVVCVAAVFVNSAILLMSHTSKLTTVNPSLLMIRVIVWMFITAHTVTENLTNNIAL